MHTTTHSLACVDNYRRFLLSFISLTYGLFMQSSLSGVLIYLYYVLYLLVIVAVFMPPPTRAANIISGVIITHRALDQTEQCSGCGGWCGVASG